MRGEDVAHARQRRLVDARFGGGCRMPRRSGVVVPIMLPGNRAPGCLRTDIATVRPRFRFWKHWRRRGMRGRRPRNGFRPGRRTGLGSRPLFRCDTSTVGPRVLRFKPALTGRAWPRLSRRDGWLGESLALPLPVIRLSSSLMVFRTVGMGVVIGFRLSRESALGALCRRIEERTDSRVRSRLEVCVRVRLRGRFLDDSRGRKRELSGGHQFFGWERDRKRARRVRRRGTGPWGPGLSRDGWLGLPGRWWLAGRRIAWWSGPGTGSDDLAGCPPAGLPAQFSGTVAERSLAVLQARFPA